MYSPVLGTNPILPGGSGDLCVRADSGPIDAPIFADVTRHNSTNNIVVEA